MPYWNIESLLQHLRELGFETSHLQKEIALNALLERDHFSVYHNLTMGREAMHYVLHITLDKDKGYCLDRYEATYIKPYPMPLGTLNGIDTYMLDKRMLAIDWTLPMPLLTQADGRKKVAAILDDLQTLKENAGEDGIRIQEWLSIKYFSNTIFEDKNLALQKDALGITMTFGNYHAHVAYLNLSGKTNGLEEMLHDMGFPQMGYRLGLAMSRSEERFELEMSLPFKLGHVFFKMPFVREGESFYPEDYMARLIYHPDIKHKVICGIDTAALEKKFQGIDWSDDYQNVFLNGPDHLYSRPVEGILEQLKALQEDKKGAFLVEQLQLKYWIGAFYFDQLIPENALKRYGSFPRFSMKVPKYTAAKDAYRLLLSERNRKMPSEDLDRHRKHKTKRKGIR